MPGHQLICPVNAIDMHLSFCHSQFCHVPRDFGRGYLQEIVAETLRRTLKKISMAILDHNPLTSASDRCSALLPELKERVRSMSMDALSAYIHRMGIKIDPDAVFRGKEEVVDFVSKQALVKEIEQENRKEIERLEPIVQFMLDKVAMDSREMPPDDAPSAKAVDLFRDILKRIIFFINFGPKLKTGVFVEDAGDIALVLQDLSLDFRVNFRVSKDGNSIRVRTINDAMETVSWSTNVSDRKADIEKMISWVYSNT